MRASVAAVRGGKNVDNEFGRVIAALAELAQRRQLPVAVVGGLAAIHHGYPAVTEDVDVVIAREDLERILVVAPEHGFRIAWRSDSGWHTLMFGDIEINVIPAGGRPRDDASTVVPEPGDLGVREGLDFADLAGWVELKIASGRRKDLTHVVEVLKVTEPGEVDRIRGRLRSVEALYAETFETLVADAEREREQERGRGRR